MSGDLVLLTGGTGHLGFRALRSALEHGYQVRAAVRSLAKTDAVRNNPALKSMSIADDQLSFIVVPDIIAADAYNEAAKGVKYIIHIASPLSGASQDGNHERDIVQPAIQGTLNILEAARKAGTVERIVITSSIIAVTPLSASQGPGPPGPPVTADDRLPDVVGPIDTPLKGYAQSKIASLNRSESWVRENNPSFDVVYIQPSYVEGRNDMSTQLEDFTRSGTNRFIVQLATGVKGGAPRANNTVHVDDAALLHVLALRMEVPGNEAYLVTSPGDDGLEWNQIKEIVARQFPDAVKKGILSTDGDNPTFVQRFDIGKTKKAFDIEFAAFERQVISVLEHYLEVYEKERGVR